MKKNLLFITLLLSCLAFSQTKIYLDNDISINIGKEFTKQKLSVDELNKFIENDKLENKFIKEKVYLESQKVYSLVNENNPKSFINVNINKITLPESINNFTMDKSEELKSLFTNYIDAEVSKNFNQISEMNAVLVDKTKMMSINGVNVLKCKISTFVKVKENDYLKAHSDVLYIFNDTNMIILSIDKSENDYLVWEKLSQQILETIQKN